MATLFLEVPYDRGCCWHLVQVEDDPRRQTVCQISEAAAAGLMECGLVKAERLYLPHPPMPEINRERIEAHVAQGSYRLPKKAAAMLGVKLPERQKKA